MEEIKIQAGSVYNVNNKLYFPCISFNGLLCCNMDFKETKVIKQFQYTHEWQEKSYIQAELLDNKLYLLPWNSNKLMVYDFCSDKMTIIEHNLDKYAQHVRISRSTAYCLPCKPDKPIIRINEKEGVELISTWNNKLIEISGKEAEIGACQKRGKDILMTVFSRGECYVLEMDVCTWNVKKLIWSEIRCPQIINSNDNFLWVADCSKYKIYKINKENIIEAEFSLYEDHIIPARIINIKNTMFLLIPLNNSCICIYENGKVVKKICIDEISGFYILERREDIPLFYEYIIHDDKIFLMPHGGNAIVIINLYDYSVSCKEITFPESWDYGKMDKMAKIQKSVISDEYGLMLKERDGGMNFELYMSFLLDC
ncbi:MAG: hypothetical protein LUG83_04985 [Lachnospiraceae bacterium]|nr:hypothetical protein [Lachnospiraceae bacterium]